MQPKPELSCKYSLLHIIIVCAGILYRVTTQSLWKCRVIARQLPTTASVTPVIQSSPSVRRHSETVILICIELSTSRATKRSVSVRPRERRVFHCTNAFTAAQLMIKQSNDNRQRFITARRSYASAVLGVVILSVRLSVCTRVLCDKTKQCTADILTPHDRVIILVF